jgi:hypothetical protein
MRVEVTGLRALIDALDQVDKNAVKHIRKEITTVSKAVVANAKGRVPDGPLSGWGAWKSGNRDLSFDASAVAGGIRVQSNRFRRGGVNRGFGYDVVNKNPAGSIFEVIGDKSRTTSKTGEQFVDSIVARFSGKPPRILMPAYYSAVTPEVQERIKDQILQEARRAGLT